MNRTSTSHTVTWLLAILLASGGVALSAADTAIGDREKESIRRDARELYEAQRFHEALPLYERLGAWYPDDPAILESWGFCVVALAQAETDPAKRKAARLRGRQILLRAKEKGDNSNFLTTVLEQLPEDSGEVAAPQTPTEKALAEGEQAFVKGDFDGALKAYAKALELDPNNYHAALFTGDVYFKEKDYARAGKWFEKATTINPDIETAWRYWGDALGRDGKLEEAKAKYIEAIIAQPYTKRTWLSLNEWAEVIKARLGHPRIEMPVKVDPDQPDTITITEDTVADGGQSAWLVYGVQRTLWKDGSFAKTYPDEKEYRHSLPEEVSALMLVAATAQKHKGDGKNISPALEALIALHQAGLLEPYVLFARADRGIAQDYSTYRAQHRDKLRKYLMDIYIYSPEEKK